MASKHRHHRIAKSRGGDDSEWNLVDVDPYTHAFDHALDYVLFETAPQFDFRHEAWPLLPLDLQDAVRAERSRRQSEKVGPRNHMFGRSRLDRSQAWSGDGNWGRTEEGREFHRKRALENNPMKGRFRELNPFFGKKHSPETRKLISERRNANPPRPGMLGRAHSEESREKMSGPRLSMQGKKHWVNAEGKTCRSRECPGPEWQRGRKWREQ